MRFFSSVNFNKNQLENAVIHVVTSDSVILSPVAGQVIYNQTDQLLKYYDGAQWIETGEFSIEIVGDSGSTTLEKYEVLTFVGGVNLTSVVDSSDRITFNLDPSIILASDITAPAGYFNNLFSSDASFGVVESVEIYTDSLASSDITSGTLTTSTLNADSGIISTLESTDITTHSIISAEGSIGTAVFTDTEVTVTSGMVIASDLIVNGTIIGSTTEVSGVLFKVSASDSIFDVEALDTLTFLGTSDELEVFSPAAGSVQIGIATNPTLSGNVTITGGLTVQGSTTTVESETLTVKDPLIELNTGIGDNNPHDLGIIMMRGASDVGENVGFIWDETVKRFKVIFTPSNASDSVITEYGYAPMAIGNVILASDVVTVGGKIKQYQGTTPNTGEILIGGADGFTRGLITGASDTGVVVSSSTDSILVSLDIDGATDGTGITVVSTDQLLLSDAGDEKRIHVGQLGSVFVRHDTTQSLSASDERQARENISAAEIITSTITGVGAQQTFYIPHNLGTKDVIVQIFDANGIQVYADVDTDVFQDNYVSVTGNFVNSEVYSVRVVGTRGTPLVVTSTTVDPSI